MKKKTWQKIFIILVALITVGLLVYFFKDIMLKLLKYEKENNHEAINALLRDKGLFGAFVVVIVQALQMIVVFISAEFIQIAASISYPWYMTILLCDLGVFFGATAIYFLVNLFKFDTSFVSKQSNMIEDIAKKKKKNNGIQSFMYILFFMPIVPFGAICYYGSSTKISYRRYILTCVTGVIPSILISMLMGTALREFISRDISIWLLVFIIVVAAALLLLAFTTIIRKLYFVSGKGTPDSIYYSILLRIFALIAKPKAITTYDRGDLSKVEGPYLLLSNHGSALDVYYLSTLAYPHKFSFILNRYYFKNKFARGIFNKMGVIPKKLFYPDIETIKKTMKSIKQGYPVLMCPEGRLSIDGTNYNITKETGKLIKSLKVPVVIAKISGAYLVNPKWRKKRIRGPVHTSVERIISKEEVENLSVDEINSIIEENLKYNEFEFARVKCAKYRGKNKAKGLENVLYYCPKCKKEYTLTSEGNHIKCSACNLDLEIDDDYSFKDNEYGIKDLSCYYKLIEEYEFNNVNKGINLETEVKVKKFNFTSYTVEEGEGVCTLDNNSFSFNGKMSEDVSFTIPMEQLKALAFSVNEEFECYYNEELYYFYPCSNPRQCTKWALLVDVMNKGSEE